LIANVQVSGGKHRPEQIDWANRVLRAARSESGTFSLDGKKFLDVAIGQAIAQVPTHRDHDDVGREPVARERRAGRREPTSSGIPIVEELVKVRDVAQRRLSAPRVVLVF